MHRSGIFTHTIIIITIVITRRIVRHTRRFHRVTILALLHIIRTIPDIHITGFPEVS